MAIETIINEKAGLPSKGRARLEYDPRGNSWFSVDADGNKKPVGGNSLSDYSQTIVVDANGNGDFTKLSEAVAAANQGDRIIVFTNIYETGDPLDISKGVHIVLLPEVQLGVNIVFSGSQVNTVSGTGSIPNGFSLTTNGPSKIYGSVFIDKLYPQSSVLYLDHAVVNTLELKGNTTVWATNSDIDRVDLKTYALLAGSYFNSCTIEYATSDVLRENVGFHNCIFTYNLNNVKVGVGNYSNVVDGRTYPNGDLWATPLSLFADPVPTNKTEMDAAFLDMYGRARGQYEIVLLLTTTATYIVVFDAIQDGWYGIKMSDATAVSFT